MLIKISRDFSETPGARHRDEGNFSGEEFRDDLLIKKYQEPSVKNSRLI